MTVTLSNTKFSLNENIPFTVQALYYRNKRWHEASFKKLTASQNPQTFTFTLGNIPKNAPFCIKLSKTQYVDYPISGNITVSD